MRIAKGAFGQAVRGPSRELQFSLFDFCTERKVVCGYNYFDVLCNRFLNCALSAAQRGIYDDRCKHRRQPREYDKHHRPSHITPPHRLNWAAGYPNSTPRAAPREYFKTIQSSSSASQSSWSET